MTELFLLNKLNQSQGKGLESQGGRFDSQGRECDCQGKTTDRQGGSIEAQGKTTDRQGKVHDSQGWFSDRQGNSTAIQDKSLSQRYKSSPPPPKYPDDPSFAINPQAVYSAAQVADILRVDVRIIRRDCQARRIAAALVGSAWRIYGAAIVDYLGAARYLKI